MNISSRKLSVTLLTAASALALSSAAWAQNTAPTETVVVTGSRVITDIRNSPTPITAVTTEQLQTTTPTNIPDALNKLPIFVGSATQRTLNNASSNSSGNTLNLRNFGSQRTLILLDNHRAVPSATDGTVDVDSLPQMMMGRVDVVTGGASAVYGSDAVTGVVNFILDKHFNGIKYNVSGGISSHGLGANYQAGVAMGTDLFGGRGHIEGSLRFFNDDPVRYLDLPYGPSFYGQVGNPGSPTNPAAEQKNNRNTAPATGLVTGCGTGCTAVNQQFVAPGVLGGFNLGAPTTTGVLSGGDGGFSAHTNGQAGLRAIQSFVRASYNLDDTTVVYIQGSASQTRNANNFYDFFMQPGTFFKNNPFLTPSAQAALNTGTGTTFTVNKTGNEVPGITNKGIDRSLSVTVGADGKWMGQYDWDVYFTHGENRLAEDNFGNPNTQRFLAAADAVTNAAGQVVCWNTTAAAGAASQAAYANCVPLNPFGLNSIARSSWDYVTGRTFFHETNTLDDLGASIGGDIFDLPAGPLRANLSGEVRWMSLQIDSPDGPPTALVNCTGLRLCPASPPLLWQNNVLASVPEVSQNVWEFAAEVIAPLLKDMPLVQSLDLNLAGRYTDYSSSGAVQTWKVGLNWHINDDIMLRGTTSVDIRAPTLVDLFGPVQANSVSFNDALHTGVNPVIVQSQVAGGNPKLVPEVARNYTAGIVLTPTFIPDLTISVDYYQINLHNAIGAINGGGTQQLCEQTAPAYNSPFCPLIARNPNLPYSDKSPANIPTFIFNQSLNAAYNAIGGTDIEVDYGFDLGDVISSWDGHVSLRELFSLQPVNESQSFTGQQFTYSAGAKARSSFFLNYTLGNWGIAIQDRWISGYKKYTTNQSITPQFFTVPRVKAFNQIDVNIDRKFDFGGGTADLYLSVNDIFDQPGPLWGGLAGNPGYSYPVPAGYPILGRVFTIGIRGNL